MAIFKIKSISGEARKAVIEVAGMPLEQIEAEQFLIFKVSKEYCTPRAMEDICATVGELTKRGMLPEGKKALVLPEWIDLCEFTEEGK